MKLEEIDELVRLRSDYWTKRGYLQLAKRDRIRSVMFSGGSHIDIASLEVVLNGALTSHLQSLHDEAKTRLMLLGVDEFPE